VDSWLYRISKDSSHLQPRCLRTFGTAKCHQRGPKFEHSYCTRSQAFSKSTISNPLIFRPTLIFPYVTFSSLLPHSSVVRTAKLYYNAGAAISHNGCIGHRKIRAVYGTSCRTSIGCPRYRSGRPIPPSPCNIQMSCL